jgi:transcriptional regulator of arginine metabolism
MKAFRQAAILEVIEQERISRQESLRERLRAKGFEVTQATLSRDMKELGLVKRASDGAYQRPERGPAATESRNQAVRRAVMECLRTIERVEQLVVLKTDPGEAQILAYAIDHAPVREVVGTIGGDDTILVICRDADNARALVDRFREWAFSPTRSLRSLERELTRDTTQT